MVKVASGVMMYVTVCIHTLQTQTVFSAAEAAAAAAAAAAQTSTPCSWTYQLEHDESRSPSALITVRCLNQPDHCEPVFATVVVKRWNSATGQLDDVNESFAVACQPKTVEQYNFHDYDDE